MKNQSRLKYARSIIGLINVSYHTMVRNSSSRNLPAPEMTKEQFSEWILKHKDFPSLYENWKKSDFDKWKRPSIDRLDNLLGYRFDNIRLVTWRENYLARDVKKCGVIKHNFKAGAKFGEWTVIDELKYSKTSGMRKWIVKCSCGIVSSVRVSALVRGKSTNCGHIRTKSIIEASTKHGLLSGCRNIGRSRPKIYRIWERLKCENKLSKEWCEFSNFLADVGFKTAYVYSLRRINNDLPYGRDNFYLVLNQRNPAVKNIKSGKSHRVGNPIEYEKQIAKCSNCSSHFYMPEIKDGVCKKCRQGHEIGNGDKCVGQADASQPCEEPKPIS